MEANVLALDSFGYSGEEEKGFQCGRFSKYIPKEVNSDAVDVSMIVTVSCLKSYNLLGGASRIYHHSYGLWDHSDEALGPGDRFLNSFWQEGIYDDIAMCGFILTAEDLHRKIRRIVFGCRLADENLLSDDAPPGPIDGAKLAIFDHPEPPYV